MNRYRTRKPANAPAAFRQDSLHWRCLPGIQILGTSAKRAMSVTAAPHNSRAQPRTGFIFHSASVAPQNRMPAMKNTPKWAHFRRNIWKTASSGVMPTKASTFSRDRAMVKLNRPVPSPVCQERNRHSVIQLSVRPHHIAIGIYRFFCNEITTAFYISVGGCAKCESCNVSFLPTTNPPTILQFHPS